MKKGFCEIICIIDRSGSMESVKSDAIGGFNAFIDKQKEIEGEASVTFIQFDNEYEVVYENVMLENVKPLNDTIYIPRGTTALLDAIGKTINSVGERLHKTREEDRPEKVIVVILTDGYENASREFTKDSISDMITHQKEVYSWEFIFLAADQDAIATGTQWGIAYKDCISYRSIDTYFVCASSLHGCVANYRVSNSTNKTTDDGFRYE